MTTIADSFDERRRNVINEATKIAQKGTVENRALTGEEQQRFDNLIGEAEKLATRAQEIRDGERRAHDLEMSFRAATGHSAYGGHSMPEGEFGKFLRAARGTDAYDLPSVAGAERRALADYRSGATEERAMSATGGVGPNGVYGTLWEYAIAGSEILQTGVTLLNTADGNTLPLPVATTHSTATSTAANAAITESDAVLTTVNLSVSKYAYISYVPNELLQDATFDIEGYFARSAGRELGKVISNVAGAAAEAGYTTQGATVANASIATGFADATVDLWHSVLPEYRASAAWLANDATYASLRKAKTSGSGEYLWQSSLRDDRPDTILGRRPFVHPALDSIGAGTKPLYFGDWSTLAVRIAGGIRFERSSDAAFANDQTAFRAIVRTGAVVVDPNAVKYLNVT